MYNIESPQAIATKEFNYQLEQQIKKKADDPIRVCTPQRRADYRNKTRLRRKDLKEVAFKSCGWGSTANIKKYLSLLGIRLDLRLTSAWDALIYELKHYIDAAASVVNALSKPKILTSEQMLEQAVVEGAIAYWREDDEGDLYWITLSPDSEPTLVTSSGLAAHLRKLPLTLQQG